MGLDGNALTIVPHLDPPCVGVVLHLFHFPTYCELLGKDTGYNCSKHSQSHRQLKKENHHLQGVHLLLRVTATDEIIRRVDQDFVEDLVKARNVPEVLLSVNFQMQI